MSNKLKLNKLRRLFALTASAAELIHKGVRTSEEVDLALRALQALKEGSLASVRIAPKSPVAGQRLWDAFSTPLHELALSKEDQKYLRQRGVRYVGELYYLFFDPRSKHTRGREERLKRLAGTALGIPMSNPMRPLDMGWEPPYWTSASFLAAINQPVLEALPPESVDELIARNRLFVPMPFRNTLCRYRISSNSTARVCGQRGAYYMAQYLNDGRGSGGRDGNSWGVGALRDRQIELNKNNSDLWAAALVPLDWTPPEEGVPGFWRDDQARLDSEEEYYKKLHMQSVERDRAKRGIRQAYQDEARESQAHSEDAQEWPSCVTSHPQGHLFTMLCEDLEVSVRTASFLRNMDMKYVGQLVQFTDGQLLRHFENFERRSIREIREVLGDMGLALNMRLHDDIRRVFTHRALAA